MPNLLNKIKIIGIAINSKTPTIVPTIIIIVTALYLKTTKTCKLI